MYLILKLHRLEADFRDRSHMMSATKGGRGGSDNFCFFSDKGEGGLQILSFSDKGWWGVSGNSDHSDYGKPYSKKNQIKYGPYPEGGGVQMFLEHFF